MCVFMLYVVREREKDEIAFKTTLSKPTRAMRNICLQTGHDRIIKTLGKTVLIIIPLSLSTFYRSTRCESILTCKGAATS